MYKMHSQIRMSSNFDAVRSWFDSCITLTICAIGDCCPFNFFLTDDISQIGFIHTTSPTSIREVK